MDKIKRHWNFLVGEGRGALVVLAVTLLLGVGLIAAAHEALASGSTPFAVARDLGSLLVVSGFVQLFARIFLWQEATEALISRLDPKLDNLRGLMAAVRPRDLEDVGVIDMCIYAHNNIDWPVQLATSRNVVVVGQSVSMLVRDTTLAALRSFLQRPDTTLTVVLSDPDDKDLMDFVESQYKSKSASRADRVRESLTTLLDEAALAGAQTRVHIKVTSCFPRYTLYRLDDRWLVTPYLFEPGNHPERLPLITVGPGQISAGLQQDIDYVLRTAREYVA